MSLRSTVSLEDFRRVIDVNLIGAFAVTRAAARLFANAGGGRIVHVGSQLSFFGGVNVAAYSASKGAIVQLAKSQANEWASLGVRVNAIAPGWIETEMTREVREAPARLAEITARIPLGRWGREDEVASAVAFLVSPAAALCARRRACCRRRLPRPLNARIFGRVRTFRKGASDAADRGQAL